MIMPGKACGPDGQLRASQELPRLQAALLASVLLLALPWCPPFAQLGPQLAAAQGASPPAAPSVSLKGGGGGPPGAAGGTSPPASSNGGSSGLSEERLLLPLSSDLAAREDAIAGTRGASFGRVLLSLASCRDAPVPAQGVWCLAPVRTLSVLGMGCQGMCARRVYVRRHVCLSACAAASIMPPLWRGCMQDRRGRIHPLG